MLLYDEPGSLQNYGRIRTEVRRWIPEGLQDLDYCGNQCIDVPSTQRRLSFQGDLNLIETLNHRLIDNSCVIV